MFLPTTPLHFALAVSLCLTVSDVFAQSEMSVSKELLSASSRKAIVAAAKSAEASGMSKQQVAEGKLLYGIRNEDASYLASAITEIETAAIGFTPQQSLSGISSIEQFRGLIAYARALMALEDNDQDEFRKQIEKGFWLFPEQASLFGRVVAREQMKERMNYLRIDFASTLLDTSGNEVPLAQLLGNGRGILCFCWRASAIEGSTALQSLLAAAANLKKAEITLVGVNMDRSNADIVARDFQKANKIAIPWLAEPAGAPFSQMWEIGQVPRAVLISDRGRILFNGTPNEPAMWKAITELSPGYQPPSRE
ncbi:MAG: redoxin domain-containing protein [Verrucomicrobiaceae bacterium]|nr:redoxin domain-containing protein [Verrucomicrobiaceae bacterium]